MDRSIRVWFRGLFISLLVSGSLSIGYSQSRPVSPAGKAAFDWKSVFQLQQVSSPQLSPDGKYLLYTRTTRIGFSDAQRSEVWLVNTTTGRQWPWRKTPVHAPQWLPDSRRIIYQAADRAGQLRYFIGQIAPVHGQPFPLPTDAENISFSPNGQWVAFTRRVAIAPSPLSSRLSGRAGWAPPARVFTDPHFFTDEQGERGPGFTHLFVQSVRDGSTRQLTKGAYNYTSGFAWLPDSKALLVSVDRSTERDRRLYNENLYRLDLATQAMRQLTHFPYSVSQPQVSPDGQHIAFLGVAGKQRSYELTQLFVTDINGQNLRSVTSSLDRDIYQFAWQADSQHLLASYDDHSITQLAQFALSGQKNVLVDTLDGDLRFSLAHNGLVAVGLVQQGKPAEIFLRQPTGRLQPISSVNAAFFARTQRATVRPLSVVSYYDSSAVGAWLTLPADYDARRRYPLILLIHGGPYGSDGPTWSSQAQLLAAAGYVVLKVNYRGSTSYGSAFSYQLDNDFPTPAVADLLSGVEAAVGAGLADSSRLFVMGGSAGGQLTAWLVGKTTRFRAAVAIKPVINELSLTFNSDQYVSSAQYALPRTIWEDPLAYWRRSPLSVANQIKTPTLLMVGEADRRTPVGESIQLYQALQFLGVPTALAIVPDATHSSLNTQPSQLINNTALILGWFAQYGGVPLPPFTKS